MTIGKWLELAKQQINTLDAELILLFGLRGVLPRSVDRSYIFAHPEVEIPQEKWQELDKMLMRRAAGEPLAYILGQKEFYGRNFRVKSTVLVPRPETEQLVELILGLNLSEKARILEVGTGSGCIAVTLSLERSDWVVVATDISEEALEVAQRNNQELGGNVQFARANLLEELEHATENGEPLEQGLGITGLKMAENGLLGQNYDVLVANLPYVDSNWEWLERASLDFEPEIALYAEEKGLKKYRELWAELAERPVKPRFLVFEADPCQHEALRAMAVENGYKWRKTAGFGLLFENLAYGIDK